MKVAILGWEYPPFKAGGLGTHCYGLTRGLADKNVKVDFYMNASSNYWIKCVVLFFIDFYKMRNYLK